MATRIGINGFGRMGRLALRAGWGRPGIQFVHVNEIAGGPEAAAHLLTFDSVHGRWNRWVEARDGGMMVDGRLIGFSAAARPAEAPWSARQVDVVLEEVNAAFKCAAAGTLQGILGYEERPLVSVDFKDDPRSAVVDALSTMVVDGTCVKVLAWYDNEIGYVNRMIELAEKVGASL